MKNGKYDTNTRKHRTRTGNGDVLLEGDLTIAQAQQIRNNLSKAFEQYDDLKVTVRNATSMDLTCIQLLYSFIKTCTLHHKKALLDIKLDPDLELLLTKCGFSLLLTKCNR